MMPLTKDANEKDEKLRRLQEKLPLKTSGPRRQSMLSVKDSWHWLRSNLWALPLMHTHIWLSAGQSLLQPFFPPLASTKAIPAWKYGFTFSSFKAFIAIGSFTSQSLIAWTSPKFVYLLGLTGFFLACASFALLYWCPNAESLLGGSIAAASLGGFMEGVYIVTLYAMCTDTFLHNKGVIIAIMDGMYGLGCMLGSVVGGALIDLWAFPLPYFVCGILLMGAMPYFIAKGTAPPIQRTDTSLSTKSELQSSYYRLLANPRFMINMGSVSLTFVMLGFYEPTLEPYVRQSSLANLPLSGLRRLFSRNTFYQLLLQCIQRRIRVRSPGNNHNKRICFKFHHIVPNVWRYRHSPRCRLHCRGSRLQSGLHGHVRDPSIMGAVYFRAVDAFTHSTRQKHVSLKLRRSVKLFIRKLQKEKRQPLTYNYVV
ncbi:uncharacterized protein LOC119396955 isoform X3 [Rhipicephalus sanguineus]|uniref:uncharacterized protein LOC119396955 isoform X3 n=1 Tax=Rhipicephalus sanguineus TaxID=34632 RepID=UPI0018950A52|nr:uncharacterized protein LOC119396955 isoform X3 [Rhipicephalus sanguineus]